MTISIRVTDKDDVILKTKRDFGQWRRRKRERKIVNRGKERDSKMRAMQEVNKSLQVLRLIAEQEWYAQHLPLAHELQAKLLKSGGMYGVTREQMHQMLGNKDPEAIDKAIEIVRLNAGIYPTSPNSFFVNWKRMASMLM
jgi:2'-5' RNA ligase